MDTTKPFFYGSSENRLNTKGQVAIPVRFRTVLPRDLADEGFVLVPGEGECLYMYTHRQFGEIRARVREVAVESGDPEFIRAFLASAHAVELDSQGRFVLPAALREAAGIAGPEVLFLGMDDRIELWCPQKRRAAAGSGEEYQQRRSQNARRIFGI